MLEVVPVDLLYEPEQGLLRVELLIEARLKKIFLQALDLTVSGFHSVSPRFARFLRLSCILHGVILDEHAVSIGFYTFSRTTNYLEKMSQEEGARFLLRRLSKVNKDEALESATPEVRAQAEDLSSLVDRLPLALDQIAAFIEEMPSTLAEYLSIYQSERKQLLNCRGAFAEDHPSVTVTFSGAEILCGRE